MKTFMIAAALALTLAACKHETSTATPPAETAPVDAPAAAPETTK